MFRTKKMAVLYTDSITEAENLFGADYGLEKLCNVVPRHGKNWHEILFRQ